MISRTLVFSLVHLILKEDDIGLCEETEELDAVCCFVSCRLGVPISIVVGAASPQVSLGFGFWGGGGGGGVGESDTDMEGEVRSQGWLEMGSFVPNLIFCIL